MAAGLAATRCNGTFPHRLTATASCSTISRSIPHPIGIVVNLNGERFIDEGADYRNHTYAKYGKEVMKQPQRAAVQIFDAKTHDNVRDEYRIREVTKANAMPPQDPQLWRDHGMELVGPPLTVDAP
jgi:hypothetical protein